MPNTLIGWYNPRTSHHPASGINDIPIIFIVYIEHDIWWSNHTQLSNQSGFWTSIMGIYIYIYVYIYIFTRIHMLLTPLHTFKHLKNPKHDVLWWFQNICSHSPAPHHSASQKLLHLPPALRASLTKEFIHSGRCWHRDMMKIDEIIWNLYLNLMIEWLNDGWSWFYW